LIDGAIEALENKSSDEKLFYMNCTIESHMPFVLEKYDEDEYDVHVTSNTLTKSQTEVIQSYAQSCYDADKQLRKIV
jgi:phosphoglycerol transferase MdoB-like AlkP superfamily enzyme